MNLKHTRRRAVTAARGFGLLKTVAVSAAVLLVAAGGLWVITHESQGAKDAKAVSALDIAKVARGSFDIETTAIGELEASNQIEIRSELDTRADIVEIVAEGKFVRKGDLLVQLNVEQLQDEIDEETLDVEQAQADVTAQENALKIQLSDNDSKRRAGELKLELARLALKQWEEGDVPKTRNQLKLDIEQAKRDLERLTERFERSEELLAEGFLSKDERDQDEISYINAQARLDTAMLDQSVYEQYQHPRDQKTKVSDVEEAEAELDRILSQNEINAAAKRSSLETARRRLELQQEHLSELKRQVDLARIIAPTDGLVVYASSVGRDRDRMMFGGEGPLQIGSEVRPNQNLIILPDTSSMVASVRVHESLAGRIRPGLPATIKVDAQRNQTYSGSVTSIGVLAETGGWRDPNRREYTVRVAIDHDNSDGELKPSMRAEGTLVLGQVVDSLIVPVQAIFSEGPVKFVLMPDGSKFRRVPVKVGRMSDAYAEIQSGVEEGQRVLLRQPAPGEVVKEPWEESAIVAVGLKLDDDGNPTIDREAMIRAMQARSRSGGGRPAGDAQAPDAEGPRGERGQRPEGTQGAAESSIEATEPAPAIAAAQETAAAETPAEPAAEPGKAADSSE